METIEERFKKMKFHWVQKKGEELSSQEYNKERTVQLQKRKATLSKIVSPDMMDIC